MSESPHFTSADDIRERRGDGPVDMGRTWRDRHIDALLAEVQKAQQSERNAERVLAAQHGAWLPPIDFDTPTGDKMTPARRHG